MTATPSGKLPSAAPARAPYTTARVSGETKPAVKTTEFIIYIVSVIAVLLASLAVGNGVTGVDRFPADRAWFYVTLLTIGYLLSRGLAKSGSRDTEHDARSRDPMTYDTDPTAPRQQAHRS
ncbi:hypothetical protein ABZ930_27540 [Streptomyces sp. NPDC046716]|uniref:hypothetical protein n=1 Tax=Streptomyces sp. NPDC046716 TaxID=3157093 RepID=UPI0034099270